MGLVKRGNVMKKYVKTNDGIWVYYEKENYATRPNKEMGCTQVWLNFKKECIVKQADNIEELIDELVIDNPENWEKKPFVARRTFDTFLNKDNAKYQKENNIKTYGAIWTDKGLIYVAKMNDKGELELL